MMVKKGDRIKARWFQPQPVGTFSLAGCQLKTTGQIVEITGTCRHLRADHPETPKSIRLYVEAEGEVPDYVPRVRPIGCTCEGHDNLVEIAPDHVVARLPRLFGGHHEGEACVCGGVLAFGRNTTNTTLDCSRCPAGYAENGDLYCVECEVYHSQWTRLAMDERPPLPLYGRDRPGGARLGVVDLDDRAQGFVPTRVRCLTCGTLAEYALKEVPID